METTASDSIQVESSLDGRCDQLARPFGGFFRCEHSVRIFESEFDVNQHNLEDLSSFSMLELFRVEAETQTALLTSGLLELERGPGAPEQLEILMRAAHSLKGAPRIVNLKIAVQVAHAMEDCFVAAQHGKMVLSKSGIDVLLRGVDLLLQISKCNESNIGKWEEEHGGGIKDVLASLWELVA